MERLLLACFGFVFLEIFGGREGGACLEKYFVCMAKQLQYFFFFSSAAWEKRRVKEQPSKFSKLSWMQFLAFSIWISNGIKITAEEIVLNAKL